MYALLFLSAIFMQWT